MFCVPDCHEILSICVLVTFVLQAVANFLAQKKFFGGKDNKELSDTHPTYLTPDGLTFAVWGIIYSLEMVMVVAQFFGSADDILLGEICGLKVRARISIAFVLNAFWLPLFNNELFFTAFVVMAVYLIVLLSINLDITGSTVDLPLQRFLLGAGLSMNASWIVIAFSLSIFFCAGELGWKDRHGVAGNPTAAAITIGVVTAIACARAIFECEIAWAFVVMWALRGIHRMQTIPDAERFPLGAQNALIAKMTEWPCIAAVACSIVVGLAKPYLLPGSPTKLL
jgi:hypothetical protein